MERVAPHTRNERPLLDGRRVALTGRLACLTRAEAVRLLTDYGARCTRAVTRRTDLLVVGTDGWPLARDGRLTRKLRRAQLLRQAGAAIEILCEDELLERLGLTGLDEPVCRRYTAEQLTRIVGVPRDRLRAWLRSGLVEPVETVQAIAYFDFRQVAALKRLDELVRSGVSPVRIRRSLERLDVWLPDVRASLDRLHLLGRRLVVRTADGGLVEAGGQRLLDFGEPAGQVSLPYEEPARDPDAVFERAVDLEDAGCFEEAAEAWRQWLLRFGPDADVCFNLGNALYALGHSQAALERYRQTVEIDPDHVPAWCNLGSLLSELGRPEESVAASRRALELDPACSDALYNLADTLQDLGRAVEAQACWQAYLHFDASGPWADYARQCLSRPTG